MAGLLEASNDQPLNASNARDFDEQPEASEAQLVSDSGYLCPALNVKKIIMSLALTLCDWAVQDLATKLKKNSQYKAGLNDQSSGVFQSNIVVTRDKGLHLSPQNREIWSTPLNCCSLPGPDWTLTKT